MCRMAGYVGPALRVEEIVSAPPHSLLVQSYRPREMQSGTVNADGYGAALWLDDGNPEPALYRTAAPIWADPNQRWMGERLVVRSLICAALDRTAVATLLLGDGEQLVGVRWAHASRPATLYWAPFKEGVAMASEPFDGGRWKEIPEGHLAIARPGEDLRLEALR